MTVNAPPDDVFGCMKEAVEIVGDVESPTVPLDDWEIMRIPSGADPRKKRPRCRMHF